MFNSKILNIAEYAAFWAHKNNILSFGKDRFRTRKGGSTVAKRNIAEDQIELCRLFSAEIEYSEENVEAILNVLA